MRSKYAWQHVRRLPSLGGLKTTGQLGTTPLEVGKVRIPVPSLFAILCFKLVNCTYTQSPTIRLQTNCKPAH